MVIEGQQEERRRLVSKSGLEIVQMNFRPLAYFVCISVLLCKEFYICLNIYLSLSLSLFRNLALLLYCVFASKNMLYFIFTI